LSQKEIVEILEREVAARLKETGEGSAPPLTVDELVRMRGLTYDIMLRRGGWPRNEVTPLEVEAAARRRGDAAGADADERD